MSNQNTFATADVVNDYDSQRDLQKPEEKIFLEFKSLLAEMKMLDIGVGAGRTTRFFAPCTKEYIGIDYSAPMIEKCKEIFQNQRDKLSFQLCDVRDMKVFPDNSFDFILFSFNGLDCISHEDRIQALHEIKRISKPGGYFCLSTHNIYSIERLLKIRFSFNPMCMAKNIVKHFLLRFLNRNFCGIYDKEYAIINDGAHRFRLKIYHISPKKQIEQLRQIGFKDFRAFSLDTGLEIQNLSEINTYTDRWLYYLCKTGK